jgi:hypothetical protein
MGTPIHWRFRERLTVTTFDFFWRNSGGESPFALLHPQPPSASEFRKVLALRHKLAAKQQCICCAGSPQEKGQPLTHIKTIGYWELLVSGSRREILFFRLLYGLPVLSTGSRIKAI